MDKALDLFEAQQKQLDGMMTHYEREINAFTTDSTKPLAARLPADQEREKSSVTISILQPIPTLFIPASYRLALTSTFAATHSQKISTNNWTTFPATSHR